MLVDIRMHKHNVNWANKSCIAHVPHKKCFGRLKNKNIFP